MDAIHAQDIIVQGRTCHTWLGGPAAAEPLLLLHGGLGDAALHWHHNFADLTRDFRVLAPDLPGFGRTAPLPQPSYPAYRAWAAAFCDVAGARQGVAVVGNSMGAAIARLVAAAYPARCARLVLVDGGTPVVATGPLRWVLGVPPLRGVVAAGLQALASSDGFMHRYIANPALLTPQIKAGIRRGIAGYVRAQRAMLLEAPLPPRALQVSCPVLVVWGAQDGLGPPSAGRALAQQLNAQAIAVIDGAGHMPMFEQPEEFARVLRRFLNTAPDA
jgi:abhydrolase domain-containing protein 6